MDICFQFPHITSNRQFNQIGREPRCHWNPARMGLACLHALLCASGEGQRTERVLLMLKSEGKKAQQTNPGSIAGAHKKSQDLS